MSGSNVLLLSILILGIVGKSNIVAAAAAILLVIQFTNLQSLYPLLERRGLELGLLFLMLSVLVPFAAGRVPLTQISKSFVTILGLIAIISGALATTLNARGLEMLQREPYMMIGLVVGSIAGIIFFRGIPVGPLMAGGIAVILIKIVELIRR
ncbi:MAG: DUF441 domain-containing protein [Bacillota bacterium]